MQTIFKQQQDSLGFIHPFFQGYALIPNHLLWYNYYNQLMYGEYTRTTSKPWLTSGAESAVQDPYILQHYGNMWVDLQAATCLTEKAGELLQAALGSAIGSECSTKGRMCNCDRNC